MPVSFCAELMGQEACAVVFLVSAAEACSWLCFCHEWFQEWVVSVEGRGKVPAYVLVYLIGDSGHAVLLAM